MIVRRIVAILVGLCVVASAHRAWAAPPETIGIVMMHGTSGVPLGTPGKSRTIGGKLIGALRGAQYLVSTPEMCWSRARIYAKSLTDCFAEIDAAIADLKAHGAHTIVVGGLSMGGNAALAYGEAHPDIAGVIACAPAHDAARIATNKRVAQALGQALDAVNSGRGDVSSEYPDANQGVNFTVTATAKAYVSYMDPDGPANIAANISRLSVPLIWIAGSQDPTQSASSSTFQKAPAKRLSRYVAVDSDHLDTCDVGTDAILQWLGTLPG
jgi:esterase/lipase